MTPHSDELFAGTPDAMTDAERELENKITDAAMRLGFARTQARRRQCWAELKLLHAQRQAHTVERLERKRGLR
jgi:hypothetical protein